MTPIEHAHQLINSNRAVTAALAEAYGWPHEATEAPYSVGQYVTVHLPLWGKEGVTVQRRARVVACAGSVIVVAIDGPLGWILRRVERERVRGI